MTDLERVGHPAGLDDDVVVVLGSLPQSGQNCRQAVSQSAAGATVRERDRLTIGRFDQIGVDVDIAEVVDQQSDP
jgi:hypothetical protein